MMESEEICSKCGKKYRVKSEQVFGIKNFFTLRYCFGCREFRNTMPPIISIKGKALKKIDRKTGQVRIKGILPEEFKNQDIMVQTFPRIVVTKPSEWKVYSRGQVHVTKQKTARVYPELSRGDIIFISGFLNEGILFSTMMLNQTIGITTEFIESEIKLKKGTFSSFKIKNPILVENKKLITDLQRE